MNRGQVLISGEVLRQLALVPDGYTVTQIRTVETIDGAPFVLLEIEGPRIPPTPVDDPFAELPTIQLRYRRADACGHPELESMAGLEAEGAPP